jgi:hypothetical protein
MQSCNGRQAVLSALEALVLASKGLNAFSVLFLKYSPNHPGHPTWPHHPPKKIQKKIFFFKLLVLLETNRSACHLNIPALLQMFLLPEGFLLCSFTFD